MTEHGQDEILELLWTLRGREESEPRGGAALRCGAGPERLLEELAESGWSTLSRGDPPHEERGGPCPRDHPASPTREVLFRACSTRQRTDGNSACQFEHILTEPVVESVCTFLAIPRLPARPPIPRGDAATGSGPRSAPRHASDRGVLGATGVSSSSPAIKEAPGEALRPRIVPEAGFGSCSGPHLRPRDRADDGRRRPGYHG